LELKQGSFGFTGLFAREQAGSAQDDTVSLGYSYALLPSFELDPRVLAGVLDVLEVSHRNNNVLLL
jgi:hypothetical protein